MSVRVRIGFVVLMSWKKSGEEFDIADASIYYCLCRNVYVHGCCDFASIYNGAQRLVA